MGEEPALSGSTGSGTVFFSFCGMSCVYCQNHRFSQAAEGEDIPVGTLAEMMLELQDAGCHNINLVSPTQYLPQIVEALSCALSSGLSIPVVYNTGGHDDPSAVSALRGIVDIYLPDMRYSSDDMARRYSDTPRYVENNRALVKEMHAQAGCLEIDGTGLAVSGLIVRLLMMPFNISGIDRTLDFLAEEIDRDTVLSVMSQYYPAYRAGSVAELSRRVNAAEYDHVMRALSARGMERGWVQPYDGDFDPSLAGENLGSVRPVKRGPEDAET